MDITLEKIIKGNTKIYIIQKYYKITDKIQTWLS